MVLMRLKGIKPVTVRYKGQVYRYYYHRATGSKIKAEWGSAAFVAEVDRLDEQAKDRAPKDGSLKALIVAYRKSPEFTDNIGQRTRDDYDKVFDYLAKIDQMPVAAMDSAFIYALRDKAYKQRKRRFANYVVQVVRLLLAWGKPRKFVEKNEAEEIKTIPRPKGMKRANRPWTDEERDTVLGAASVEVRAMVALAMFAGLREGDACVAPKRGYDGQHIETIASKNREPLAIPAHFRLREILTEAAQTRREKMARRAMRRKVLPMDPATLAVTSRGRAWTESGFRSSFFTLIGKLTEAGSIAPGLTYHGLRHTLGKLVIEAGGSKEDVARILGDRSEAMGAFYSREYEKRGRLSATMLKLEQTERGKMAKTTDAVGKKIRGQNDGQI